MFGGLSLRHHALVATAAAALMGAFSHLPVEAADLGGDCCADLEERVAELEATTVRKGNKKVKVELYGRMNRVANFWNDGAESNVYSLNNSYSTDRFGIRGKGKISDDWSSGFVIEIEDTGNQSRFVNQFNDNTDNGALRVRKAAISLESKTYGRVWLGQQEMAKDNINKDTVVIKGLDQTMHQDFYMNWSFFLRQKGFDNAEAFSVFDAALPRYRPLLFDEQLGLRLLDPPQEVRYDTPEWWGFVGSASWGEDDIWSASLRFQKEWDNWKIGAGYAYEDFTDELVNNGGGGVFFQGFKRDMKEWAGTASIIHKPTGLFLWGANSNSENNDIGAEGVYTGKAPPVMHAWDIAGGISKAFFSPGATTIWGGFTQGPGRPRRLHPDDGLLVGVGHGVILRGVGWRSLRWRLPWHPVQDRDHELRDHEMVPRRRSGDRLRGAQSLCRLPAHRARDQTRHPGSCLLSDRHAQERSDRARRFRRVLHGRPHPVLIP